MKYTFIDAEKATHSVSILCRMLKVSRSGYYDSRSRGLSKHACDDARIAAAVADAFRLGRGAYGSPRVLDELRDKGVRTSKKRVARLMRERSLFGQMRRRWRTNTAPSTSGVVPNHLQRRFNVGAPNRTWAGDITYIRTWEGWLFLAVVIDLFSRRVVGWAMQAHIRGELATEAMVVAIGRRLPPPGLLHHSDRGSQYGSDDYRRLLASHGIECSMSRKGNCWDNAVVESFFSTLKRELIYRRSWPTKQEAKACIQEWIENFYNRERRHSYLGSRSPNEYERLYEANKRILVA